MSYPLWTRRYKHRVRLFMLKALNTAVRDVNSTRLTPFHP